MPAYTASGRISGLWSLYRYNPDRAAKPFSLDCKQPSLPVSEFPDGETRYAGLKVKHPEAAAQLDCAPRPPDADIRMSRALEKVKFSVFW